MGGRRTIWLLAGALLGMSLLGLAGPGRASWPTEVSLYPYDVRANSTVKFDLHIVNDKATDAMEVFWVAATFCWNTSYPGVWFKPFTGDFINIPPSISADIPHEVKINRTVPGPCPVVIYINSAASSTPATTTNVTAWINVLPVPAPPPPSPPPVPALEARLAPDVHQGLVPLTVALSAAAQGGLPPYTFVWHFGDRGEGLEQYPIHIYVNPGDYDVTSEVVDSSGLTATSNVTVRATAAPPPTRAPDQPFYSTPGNVASLALGIAALALAIELAGVRRRRRPSPAAGAEAARAPPGGPRATASAPGPPFAQSCPPPPVIPSGPQEVQTAPAGGA